jgi:hypothetical protein
MLTQKIQNAVVTLVGNFSANINDMAEDIAAGIESYEDFAYYMSDCADKISALLGYDEESDCAYAFASAMLNCSLDTMVREDLHSAVCDYFDISDDDWVAYCNKK